MALSSSARLEYKRRRFTRTRRTGDQEDAVRLVHHFAQPGQRLFRHAKIVEVQPAGLFVQQSQHDAFAIAGGHGRNAYVDLAATNAQRNASVLRYALFCDVQFRHHFDARYQQRCQGAFRLDDFAHHAVDSKTHDQLLFEGFDVDIGGVFANRFGEQRIDQADDRCVVFLVEQIFRFRHRIGEARKIEFVAHVLDHLPRLRRVARIRCRQNRFELFVRDLTQRNRRAGKSAQLGQHRQIRLFSIGDIDRLGRIDNGGGDRHAESSRERERQQRWPRLVFGLEDLTHRIVPGGSCVPHESGEIIAAPAPTAYDSVGKPTRRRGNVTAVTLYLSDNS